MQVLSIIASSWPIALMVIGLATILVINRRLKQAMDDSRAVHDLRASQSLVVRGERFE